MVTEIKEDAIVIMDDEEAYWKRVLDSTQTQIKQIEDALKFQKAVEIMAIRKFEIAKDIAERKN